MGEHAKLSPSSGKRWLTCPASVEAEARVAKSDNEHSLAGTAAHWVREQWMTKGEPPPAGVKAPNGIDITQEMLELVGVGVGWTRSYIEQAGGRCTLLVEEKVQIAEVFGLPAESCWGTTDQIIVAPKELVVYDLKFGYVDVVVDDNTQLTLYAIGACEALGWMHDTIRFVIDQPKNGGIKEWTTTKADLLKKVEEWKPKMLLAMSPDAPYVPSEEGCRNCAAAGVCVALQKYAIEAAKAEFSDVSHITVEQLSLILQKADLVETAIKAARQHALKLIQLGQEVPGYKVVEGRKNRAWREGVERTVMENAEVLGFDLDILAPRKLCSPAQAEKAGLKQMVEQFAEKPKGNPVLAPSTDKRPALPAHFEALDVGDVLD